MRVVLIGFSGVGKTTLGRAVAEKICFDFFDCDDVMVSRTGRKIPEIFKTDGEAKFRELEFEILKELLKSTTGQNCVIATGGGVIENSHSCELLKEEINVLYLRCDKALMEKRANYLCDRPILQASDWQEIYFRRESLYESVAKQYVFIDENLEDNIIKLITVLGLR